MKKLLLLSSLFLFGCAKPTPVIVKVPVPVAAKVTYPDVYLMCSGRLFKGIIVSINGVEAVYRCPDAADVK